MQQFMIREVGVEHWNTVFGEDLVDAIQSHHMKNPVGLRWFDEENSQTVVFTKFDVLDHGQFLSRVFRTGIGRKGGVKRRLSLAEIARRLNVSVDDLSDEGWEGESQDWERY